MSARRRMWPIVARREFVERARDRGFQVSTVITLLLLVGVIVVSAAFNRPTSFDLVVVGAGSEVLGGEVRVAADALGFEVHVLALPDRAEAERAVDAGDADAALVNGDAIVVRDEPPEQLVGLIQAVSLRERSRQALVAAGLSDDQVDAALLQRPLPVDALEPVDARRSESATVAFVGVLLLYGQSRTATGSPPGWSRRSPRASSRSSSRPSGLASAARQDPRYRVARAPAAPADRPRGPLRVERRRLAGVPIRRDRDDGVVLVWFVLGFFFYAGLFAVAGSIVTRQEDLQTTMTPLTILIIASFIIGLSATGDPDSTLAVVASLLRFSSPLVMPTRIVLGDAAPWEVVASLAISVVSTAALIPIATKIYSRALLRPGRVRIRQVLRAGGD